jgi:hypothetical protein
MKYPIALSIILFTTILVRAQEPTPYINQQPEEKPSIFHSLPQKIQVKIAVLEQLFTRSVNNRFAAGMHQQLVIDGIVLEKVTISKQQESINIRCVNFANALLNVSKIRLPNNKIKYTGRIISPQHGDILTLGEENGQYYFTRQKQLLIMVQ